MKKKIFCTLGPSTLNSKFLKFANKKINLLRLNMSHVNVNKLDKLSKEYAECNAKLLKKNAEVLKNKASNKIEQGKKKFNKLNIKDKLLKFKNSKSHKDFVEN